MKAANKLLSLVLIITLALTLCGTAFAAEKGDIVILYTNDVHCGVEDNIGYAGLAAYSAEMEAEYGAGNVTLVDAGDAVQGAAIGTLSKGSMIIDIMNELGYDVCVPGNHEFDYGMDTFKSLMAKHKAAVVSCNLTDLVADKKMFDPYTIISYGDVDVAYVGICTPETYTSSSPTYFMDADGNYIYGFCEGGDGQELYTAVQTAVDSAVKDGADYVIAVGHLGDVNVEEKWSSTTVIANTTGIDAFIDGHAHETIAGRKCKNKAGEDVILTSTGTKLENIGKLVISADGTISSSLITGYEKKDAEAEKYISGVTAQFSELLKTVVAKTSVDLTIMNPATDVRLVRSGETNLGDLCADAYREILGADIAFVNGGGVRDNIPAGDITYEQIIAVHPFGNMGCVIEVTGQDILDALETCSRDLPAQNGSFLQVSGLTYEIDATIPSSVKLDDKNNFISVDGAYRVHDVMVGGKPLDLTKTYTLASHNYTIKLDGLTMFNDNKILQDEVMLDNQILINYITDSLGGVVGDEYADPYGQGRITIKAEPFEDVKNDAWYYDAVVYNYQSGYVLGKSEAMFDTSSQVTKNEYLTIIYRMAKDIMSLEDKQTSGENWREAAQYLAGLLKLEMTDMDAAISREEMAYVTDLFFDTYCASQSLEPVVAEVEAFTDASAIDQKYAAAVTQLAGLGVIEGFEDGTYQPAGTLTRAQTAQVFYKLMNNVQYQTAEVAA